MFVKLIIIYVMACLKKSFFQNYGFETLANFPIFSDFLLKSHIKNENVELVSILFQSRYEY
jgi:hypothetical protein